MSGILRQLVYFCFLGLMIGSLWLSASSATVPSIPPWRDQDQKNLDIQRQLIQQSRIAADLATRTDHDLDIDVDDTTASTTAAFDDDESEFARRST